MKFFWLVWPRSKLPGLGRQLQPKVNCSSLVQLYLRSIHCPRRKYKKAADFSAAFACEFFSVAVGADADADAGSAEADAITIFIVTALDVALARSVVTIGVADDDASFAAFPPALAVFLAYHADVLDVAVRSYRWTGSERRSSGGSCEECTCAHRERDRYLGHDVLQTGVSKCQTASPLFWSTPKGIQFLRDTRMPPLLS